jgi:hypothetical protein
MTSLSENVFGFSLKHELNSDNTVPVVSVAVLLLNITSKRNWAKELKEIEVRSCLMVSKT